MPPTTTAVARPAGAPPTRAEWVDGLLRSAILQGEFLPGEKLYAERLAERWGVSPTPVRETFQRLAGEGLVVIEPQKGARVAPLSVEEATEVYELRLLLDPVAVEQSVAAGREVPSFAAEVGVAHAALVARHRSAAEYHEAHRVFHLALVSRCPNGRLVQQVAQLMAHSQRFHAVGAVASRAADPAGEHLALRDAAVAGDGALAAEVLRAHLRGTLDAVRASA